MCTLSDCYGPQLGGEVGRNANILQITAIVCYILLWIRLRTIDKKNSDGKFCVVLDHDRTCSAAYSVESNTQVSKHIGRIVASLEFLAWEGTLVSGEEALSYCLKKYTPPKILPSPIFPARAFGVPASKLMCTSKSLNAPCILGMTEIALYC